MDLKIMKRTLEYDDVEKGEKIVCTLNNDINENEEDIIGNSALYISNPRIEINKNIHNIPNSLEITF